MLVYNVVEHKQTQGDTVVIQCTNYDEIKNERGLLDDTGKPYEIVNINHILGERDKIRVKVKGTIKTSKIYV